MFENFDFHLQQGEFRVLMGKSGTGKTSLVKCIIGQIPVPHKTFFYREEDMAHFSEHDREAFRKKIGVVFQDYKLFDNLSVQENVGYPLTVFGLGETIIENKVTTILKTLGLHAIRETAVQLLSAGEKQKVCLARALVHDPEFIIADEPTGNLDREHTQQVADLLIQANKQGNTVFLITHDIHLVHYLKEKHTIKLDILH
ncbi:MAG: ATP-binding cassette domain-containing protein [bacterium]